MKTNTRKLNISNAVAQTIVGWCKQIGSNTRQILLSVKPLHSIELRNSTISSFQSKAKQSNVWCGIRYYYVSSSSCCSPRLNVLTTFGGILTSKAKQSKAKQRVEYDMINNYAVHDYFLRRRLFFAFFFKNCKTFFYAL